MNTRGSQAAEEVSALMHEEQVVFCSAEQNLVGLYRVPDGKPGGAVVFCHAFGSSKAEDRFLFTRTARALNQRGLATLQFDFRGAADSSGELEEITLRSMANDVKSAEKFIHEKLPVARTALLGYGLGCAAACRAAAETGSARALVLWLPRLDPYPGLETVFKPDVVQRLRTELSVDMADLADWSDPDSPAVRFLVSLGIPRKHACGENIGLALLEELRHMNLGQALDRIGRPALLIVGRDTPDDRIEPLRRRQHKVHRLAEASYCLTFPDVNESLMERVADLSVEFLGQHLA